MVKIKALLFVRTPTLAIPKIGKVHVPVYSTLNFVRTQTLAKVRECKSAPKKRLQEPTLISEYISLSVTNSVMSRGNLLGKQK